jgi:hypothetical protein
MCCCTDNVQQHKDSENEKRPASLERVSFRLTNVTKETINESNAFNYVDAGSSISAGVQCTGNLLLNDQR